MKAFKISVSVIVCLILLAAMIYMNYGGFSTVHFQMISEGGETLVFRDIKGPYSITGDEISKINYDLENRFNIESLDEFGMYYDNPRMIAGNRLHSEAGCIIENTDTGKLMKLKSDYRIKVYPVKKYITAEFPYKGRISIMIGMMKVYPALSKYLKANGYSESGPVLEIYDRTNNKIRYRKEAVKREL